MMQEKRLSRILGIYRSNPSGSVLKVWKSYPESFYKKLVNKRFFLKIRDNPTFGITTKLYPLLPTTPGTANLTNFPKRKTPQSATFQSLCINKNERTLFPRFVVVGFLYSFCSSRQDFQIFFAHTVKHGIELTAACGFLLFPFREKELVY